MGLAEPANLLSLAPALAPALALRWSTHDRLNLRTLSSANPSRVGVQQACELAANRLGSGAIPDRQGRREVTCDPFAHSAGRRLLGCLSTIGLSTPSVTHNRQALHLCLLYSAHYIAAGGSSSNPMSIAGFSSRGSGFRIRNHAV